MSPSVSVLIVSYNSASTIRECLMSLAEAGEDLSIVMIDNASADATVCAARSAGVELAILSNGHNVGFSAACNQGLSRISSDLVLFLNPDTIVRGKAIAVLRAFLACHPDYVGAGPSIYSPEGVVQRGCARRDLTAWRAACQLLWLDTRWKRSRMVASRYYQPFDYDRAIDVECLSGAAMMCRVAAVKALGGFDEAVPLYLDDNDLCRRLRSVGRLAFLPDATVVHVHNVSGESLGDSTVRLLSLDAGFVYLKKHCGRGSAYVYRVVVLLGSIEAFAAGLGASVLGRRSTAARLFRRGVAFLEWFISPVRGGQRRRAEFATVKRGDGSESMFGSVGARGPEPRSSQDTVLK